MGLRSLRLPSEWVVRQVSCGHRHAALVTTTGLLLTFGCGETGRLGHGDQMDVSYPKLVQRLASARQAVVSAACGREHTLVSMASGQVKGWGWGEGGRLGLGEVGAVLWPETLMEVDHLGVRAASVACGREHSLVVTTDGRMLAFGTADGGKLGLGNGTRVGRVGQSLSGAGGGGRDG
ncbi:unnamed protein product, partial [Choristocarpus tenellus]